MTLVDFSRHSLEGALETMHVWLQLGVAEWRRSPEEVQFFRETSDLAHAAIDLASSSTTGGSEDYQEPRRILMGCLSHVNGWNFTNPTSARYRRLATITTLKVSVHYVEAFKDRLLVNPLAKYVLDTTLFNSHTKLHQDLCGILRSVAPKSVYLEKLSLANGALVDSLKDTANLMNSRVPHNSLDLLKKIGASLLTYNWHEWLGLVPLALKACSAYGKHLYTKDRPFLDEMKDQIGRVFAKGLLQHDCPRYGY